MGDDGTAAQELADMISASAGKRRPGRIQRLLSGSVFLPLGLNFGRQLAARLLDVDPAVRDRELAKIRARNAARVAEAEPAAGRPASGPADPGATGAGAASGVPGSAGPSTEPPR
jgi:hypothetical protein